MHSRVHHLNLTISALSTKCTDSFTNTSLSRPLDKDKKAATDVNETQRGCWPTHPVMAGHARVSKSKANVQQTPTKEATVLLSGSWAGRVLGLSLSLSDSSASVGALDLSGDFLNLDRMPVAGELAVRGVRVDWRCCWPITHSQQAL